MCLGGGRGWGGGTRGAGVAQGWGAPVWPPGTDAGCWTCDSDARRRRGDGPGVARGRVTGLGGRAGGQRVWGGAGLSPPPRDKLPQGPVWPLGGGGVTGADLRHVPQRRCRAATGARGVTRSVHGDTRAAWGHDTGTDMAPARPWRRAVIAPTGVAMALTWHGHGTNTRGRGAGVAPTRLAPAPTWHGHGAGTRPAGAATAPTRTAVAPTWHGHGNVVGGGITRVPRPRPWPEGTCGGRCCQGWGANPRTLCPPSAGVSVRLLLHRPQPVLPGPPRAGPPRAGHPGGGLRHFAPPALVLGAG